MNKQTNQGDFSANSSPPWQKLLGRITRKEKKKVYNKKSDFYGNTYFKLQIVDEELKEREIFVYPNLVRPKIFSDITNNVHVDNWYLFFSKRKGKRWVLHNWQELNPKKPILKNHD